MRTTVDLPADLHAQAVSIARDTHWSLSETVAFLMRRGLGESRPGALTHSAATGLPIVRLGRMITTENVRSLEDPESARSVLQEITSNPQHEFWPDNAPYHDIPVAGVIGQRQVTDAYLAHLARSYSARLATFDLALAKLHTDVAV
jgi:predicted nucleic acid-binding protein